MLPSFCIFVFSISILGEHVVLFLTSDIWQWNH